MFVHHEVLRSKKYFSCTYKIIFNSVFYLFLPFTAPCWGSGEFCEGAPSLLGVGGGGEGVGIPELTELVTPLATGGCT